MVSLKHAFNSGKAQGTDATLIGPNQWNAEHTLTTTAGGVVLGRPVGAGGPVQEITMASIVAGLQVSGMIMLFGGLVAPTGWLLCQGQLVSKTTYAALYTALGSGTLYGQSGTNFNLPDLRSRVPAGAGGTLLDNVTFNKRTVGGVGGADTVGLTSGHLPAHSHTATVSDPTHGHSFTSDDGFSSPVYPTHMASNGSSQYAGSGSYLRQAYMNYSSTGISVGISGGGNGTTTGTVHSNTQPTILLNYIIKT